MKDTIKKVDLSKVNRYSLKDRFSRVEKNMFSKKYEEGGTFNDFICSLPATLKAKELNELVGKVKSVIKNGKMFILGMGGHVIKVGLSPVIIDMVELGFVKHVVFNGSCMIHDFEISFNSATSENVDVAIEDGSFGMALETGKMLNEAIVEPEKGLGFNIGKFINESDFPNKNLSILSACYKKNIPVTVHVAFGSDIIHCHPEFKPEITGVATHSDFKKMIQSVSALEGGAFLNFGSAVIIPEVFLKALTVARNLGFTVKEIYTANFDFIGQYRSIKNIVDRPTSMGGKGFNFIGHHELLLPLFYAFLKESLRNTDEEKTKNTYT